jgi:hypothetical protein
MVGNNKKNKNDTIPFPVIDMTINVKMTNSTIISRK